MDSGELSTRQISELYLQRIEAVDKGGPFINSVIELNPDALEIADALDAERKAAEEFLVHAVYGCQVVVTNPTSSRQKLTVLVHVPIGAIPVLNSQFTKTVHMTLEPYHTQTVEYHFYFPAAGTFPHFPVHVAKNEELIASPAPFAFNVVDKPTKIDTGSWDYVSQKVSSEDVLSFLGKHNINQLTLDKIAFRMRDKAVFDAVIAVLTQRRVYHPTLWSYALLHNVAPAAREYLCHQKVAFPIEDCGRCHSKPVK